MHWTKQTPTQPGYYWWRFAASTHAEPVQVGRYYVGRINGVRQITAEEMGGEWYGPIGEPDGDAIENCQPEEDKP